MYIILLAALQAAVTPLGDKGIPVIPGVLTLNMYTAAGWINVLLGIFNCLLFLPSVFRERRIAAREAMLHHGMESGMLFQTRCAVYKLI
jgi:ceroid-lipofuscinosis MFS transporter 7